VSPARPTAPAPQGDPGSGARPAVPADAAPPTLGALAGPTPQPADGANGAFRPANGAPRPAIGANGATAGHGTNGAPTDNGIVNGYANGNGRADGNAIAQNGGERTGCTAPQLRRFIKSRPYVPMHELRRRFAIDGNDDDVTPVDLEGSKVFVGLPPREGSLLGELLRGGEIGYELSFDPLAPIVVGVYPMRPVPRT
jgi:hypothetical protein